MKIAYISNQVIPSKSAESIFVAKSCDNLQASNNDVTLYCPFRKNFFVDTDVKNHYSLSNDLDIKKLPFPLVKGKYFIYHLFVLINLILKRPDLVYSRTIIGGAVAYLLQLNFVLELHSLPPTSSLDGKILAYLRGSRHFKLLISISNALKNDLMTEYSFDSKSIYVEHDATDIRAVDSLVESYKTHKSYKLGYVGSLYPGKGMEVISEVSHLLSGLDVEFHVYGGTNEEINSWKDKSAENVKFFGYIPYSSIFDAIDTFDVCLLPNQPSVQCAGHKIGSTDIGKYTSPMKMFDYMSSQKPIISSDLEILREVLDDECSYFAKHNDNKDWVQCIDRVISDYESAMIKATKAFGKVSSFYNWKLRMDRIMREVKCRE